MIRKLNNYVTVIAALLIAIALPPASWAGSTADLPDGSKLDLSAVCPVCNMKVDSTTLGPAAVVLKDGKVIGFDGAGDMIRYVLAPAQYGGDPKQISHMFVTLSGGKAFADATKAVYVLGSDVKDNMGPALVPFAHRADAEKFKAAHHGTRIATFGELKPADVAHPKKRLKMKGH